MKQKSNINAHTNFKNKVAKQCKHKQSKTKQSNRGILENGRHATGLKVIITVRSGSIFQLSMKHSKINDENVGQDNNNNAPVWCVLAYKDH